MTIGIIGCTLIEISALLSTSSSPKPKSKGGMLEAAGEQKMEDGSSQLAGGTEFIPPTPSAALQCVTVINSAARTTGPANSLLLVLPRITQTFHLRFSRFVLAESIHLSLSFSFVSCHLCLIM